MIPFQRQLYEAIEAKKAREQQERMPDQPGGGSGHTRNSHPGAGGGSQTKKEDTVRYRSESEGNEANTSFID
jgi:hypothetical protein